MDKWRWSVLLVGCGVACALGCGLDDRLPEPSAARSVAIIPASREIKAVPGETVSFAFQTQTSAGAPVNGVEVFVSTDQDAPLAFEKPSSDSKVARARTQTASVEGLALDGMVTVRLRVAA